MSDYYALSHQITGQSYDSNRLLLKDVMVKAGFERHPQEAVALFLLGD